MHIDRTSAARAGDHGPHHPTHLPPPPDPPATTQSVTAGDNARITQKNTQVKFSIPVIGPLLTLAWAHPLLAGAVTVALVGGGGIAVSALPDSGSGSSPSTELVRGFEMKVGDEKAPTGYDFTHNPPQVADSGTDAVYVQGNYLYSTNGKISLMASADAPTAEGCREAVSQNPERQIFINISSLVCYMDGNGDPGYISVTAFDSDSLTIDTAHLR